MRANIFLLYGSTVMIFGTTWLAIKFQLGSVDPMVSVLYRFVAAAMILIFYCKLLGLRMRFQLKDHVFMNMINGALLMGSPIRLSVVVGGGVGIVGIVFVFWPEISAFSLSDK
ncbi:MAG: EamA family transporter, partial [Desulfobacterales bacterium]